MKHEVDSDSILRRSIRLIALLLVAIAELSGLMYSSNGMALEVNSISQAYEDGFGEYDSIGPSSLSFVSTSAVNASPHSSAAAWSAVDARNGTLRGFASVHVTDSAYWAGSRATGTMKETITIGFPDGPVTPGDYKVNLSMPYDFHIIDGNSDGSFFLLLSLRRCENLECTEGDYAQHFVSSARGSSVVDGELDVSVPIDFIHTTYEVNTWFQAGVDAGYVYEGTERTIDFSSTATLNLNLPEGFTYTALSPDFLKPVPLPLTLPLFASAATLLFAARRRM